MIAARSWERAKGLTRIQFLAGIRVLADYRKANKTTRDVAAMFSAGREDSPTLVARLLEENKKLLRRSSDLEEVTCRLEAEELLMQETSRLAAGNRPLDPDPKRVSPTPGAPAGQPGWGALTEGLPGEASPLVIARVFDDRDADSLKHLALALIAHSKTVALLGSRDGDAARLVFARSSDAGGDMNTLMREACSKIEGRGGGKPDIAQGGGKNVASLDKAIQAAARSLVES